MEENTQKGFIYFVHLLLKKRKFILLNFFFTVFITYGIVFLLPKWYLSKTVVLPPASKEQGGFSNLLGGGVGSILGGLGFLGQSGAYNYVAILTSRTLQEDVIRKFDLFSEYDIPDTLMEKALKAFDGNTMYKITDEGALVIGIYDKNPVKAANIANYIVERINYYNTKLTSSTAKIRKEFLQTRLSQIEKNIEKLEDRIKVLQNKGFFIGSDQVSFGLEAISNLYAQKVLKEMKIELFRRSFSKTNAELKKTEMELEIINSKLKDVPELTVESMRIYREFLIKQKVLELLTPLLEQAKLEELQDTPSVVVLDKAVPPEKKARPKRLLISLSMGITVLVLNIIYFVTSDYLLEKAKNNPAFARQLNEISTMLRSTFLFWKK